MVEKINQKSINDNLDYSDGVLRWKEHIKGKRKNIAGGLGNRGYLVVGFLGKLMLVHRLVFLMHKGYLPEFIDHIDGNPLNNKIENLRGCTGIENQRNSKLKKNNTSGVKSVYWNKKSKKWLVYLSLNYKKKYFGGYDDIELAELVASEARDKYHGEFARNR